MRLYWGFALAAVLAAAPATIASADIQLQISMVYQWSDDGAGHTTVLPNVAVPGGGAALSQVNLTGGAYVNHVFNVYATVTGLAADRDMTFMQVGGAATGGVTATIAGYTTNSYTIDPPSMGSPASDAPAATWCSDDTGFNGNAYLVGLRTGESTGGPQGNDYGDYAAAMQLGESGPFLIGQQVLSCDSSGAWNLVFDANPGYLKIISGNIDGAAGGTASESYPTYSGVGDSVLFAPRGPTDLTWADGATSTWAVADGTQHWKQTASPTTPDDFYHMDTVRFTSNTAASRTVTLTGNLNPTSVVVDSSDDYVFTGSGAIIGAGTTLLKQGTGKLTVSNAGPNTYTGLTTVQGGTVQLNGAAARNPVLNLGGADIQHGWSTMVFDYSGAGDSDPTGGPTGVLALLTASYHGGLWDTGKFLSSTAVAEGTTLGWKDDTGAMQVTVMSTLPGDGDLSGTVDSTDLGLVINNYNHAGEWDTGDFNYDGVVDSTDLGFVINNYNHALPLPSEVLGGSLDAAGIAMLGAAGIHVVPEPGTLALLAAGLIGLLAYARRKRK